MDYKVVAAQLHGIPHMTAAQGSAVYRHVLAEKPREILEIGTANGVGAAYMAAALQELAAGRITSLDSERAAYSPGPRKVLGDLGLLDFVQLVRNADSSYNWWLQKLVKERSDEAGNVSPIYDFIYLDGAHELSIDGLAVVLAEKLLKPGGWLLLDDLDWSFARSPTIGPSDAISTEEAATPHMRIVWEVVVKQHPAFTTMRVEGGAWGWARKDPEAPRRLELVAIAPSILDRVLALAVTWRRKLGARTGR